MSDSRPAGVRRRIIEAAAVEFSLRGLAATKMEDVAARAGIQRPNLYRYVQSKEELLSLVLTEQVRTVHGRRRVTRSLKGAVGPVIVAELEREHHLARDDELLRLARSEAVAADIVELLRSNEEIFSASCEFWEPVLRYGRSRGEIRDDIDDTEIIRWFFLIQYMLIVNERIFKDKDEIQFFLRRMVAAAVLNDPGSV